MEKHTKIVKAINADNEAKRLKITFEDGSLGYLTFKQIERFYDMQAKMPQVTGEYIPPKMQVKQKNIIATNIGLGGVNPNFNLNSNIIYNNFSSNQKLCLTYKNNTN